MIFQSQGVRSSEGTPDASKKESLTKLSWLAGIVGPIAFGVVYTVFGLLSPGYSQYTQPISNLELVQNGWIQQLNFLQCGSLIAIFAFGFRQAMRQIVKRRLRLITALLVLSGSGMIVASYFTPAHPIEHTLAFLFFIIPLTASFFLVGRQLLQVDSSWKWLGIYSLISGFVTTILLLLFFSFGAVESLGFIGVINRLFVMESLAWPVVFGAKFILTNSYLHSRSILPV